MQTGIVLQVNSNPTIGIKLTVGSVSEQVQVEASGAVVETQSTAVGNVVDNQRMLELPLNGRSSQELMLTAGPAVSLGAAPDASAATDGHERSQLISPGH